VLLGYLLVAYFLLMLPQFRMPQGDVMLALFAAGICSGCGHLLILAALNRAPANRVGPTQYTQILWAVILGAVFFSEYPALMTYFGLGVVGLSGVCDVAPAGSRNALSRATRPSLYSPVNDIL